MRTQVDVLGSLVRERGVFLRRSVVSATERQRRTLRPAPFFAACDPVLRLFAEWQEVDKGALLASSQWRFQ